jgi:osmoprotectant transport system permease protein
MLEFISQNYKDILTHTGEHLWLASISTLIAAAIGIPLGIFITRRPQWSRAILGTANVIQTIPSLAFLGFLVPLPFIGGIGARSAIFVLTLYALLPIIRNTVAGISGIDRAVREAGVGMGMTDKQLLRMVELPLASGVIFAGIRIATVLSIAIATVAALIGAGGLGMYIFRGISMLDSNLILVGAIPSAILALAADGVLGMIERRLTAKTR